MKPLPLDKQIQHQIDAKRRLYPLGWVSLGDMVFMAPGGSIHDLSAADLNQLDKIEREGLFLKEI